MARVIGTLASAGDTQAPTQPQNLQATAINRQRVDLSWTASTDNVGVTGYQIFRDAAPLDVATGTTFSDTTASASTTYTYTVVAFDGAGNNSIASAAAQATTPANASPSWDTIATQTLIVGDSYSLNLNDVCEDADADTIQYSIPSGTLPTGLTRSGAIISGTPTTAGQNPTVTVRAFDGFVNVDTEIEFETFTADTTAPPVPTGLSATAASASQINLSWNDSTDAAGGANHFVSGTQDYRVYRSTDQTNFSLRTTVTGTSYQDTGLSATTRYDYKIAARDVELNESAQSTAVNATTLTSSVSAALEADWQTRIANSVWYHDFRSAAEVNQFRWVNAYGQDPLDQGRPGQTTWVADDGITGGCLESRHNASGPPNPPDWWRPMCPLDGDSNGRGVDDPAANGTLTLRSFSPTDGGDELLDLNNVGQYGPVAHHGDASFDGTEYWLQMRVKISANRVNTGSGPSGDEGGKILYFTNTRRSNSDQELVTNSYYNVAGLGDTDANLFQMYRSGGHGLTDPPDDNTNARQIGGEYNGGVCTSSPLDDSGCWFWPDDETSAGEGKYVTLLYQVIPGGDGVTNTVVRVWKAEWGETSYTKIWDQTTVALEYDTDMPRGHNAIICSGYQNEISFSEEVWHRYAQIIFSKQSIPCPQVYDEAPSSLLSTTAASLAPGGQSTVLNASGLGTAAGQDPEDTRQTIQWGNRFFYDHGRGIFVMAGKDASAGGGTGHRSTSIYTAETDSWATSGRFHIDGVETGHIYESPIYDPDDGTLYINQWGTEHFERWTVGSPLTSGWTPTANDPLGHWAQNAAPVNRAGAWHPNLFGVGDPGIVFICNIDQSPTMQVRAWRKSTNTYHGFPTTEHDVSGDTNSGSCVYVSSGDYVIVTHGFGNTYRIPAGSGGSLGTPTQMTNPPIICSYTNSGARGMLFDDPTGLAGPYILEKCGTNRVWRLISNAWSLRSYTHPLPGGSPTSDASWYVANCRPLGVFVSYRRSGDPALRIWRPND